MKQNDSVIVSWDFTNGKDKSVLIVGHQSPKKPIEIINAFQGEEAERIHALLTTPKTKKD